MFLVIGSKKVTSQVYNLLKTPQAEKIFYIRIGVSDMP